MTNWEELYLKDVVFGEDTLDKIDTEKKRNKISSKMGRDYVPKYISIDNKTYIIRAIKGFNDSFIRPGVTEEEILNPSSYIGSEWNRLILPIIGINGNERETTAGSDYQNNKFGRYGNRTESIVEKSMPTLSKYSWWYDLSGPDFWIRHDENAKLIQETNLDPNDVKPDGPDPAPDPLFSVSRGSSNTNYGAASAYDGSTNRFVWLPVLERVDNQQ